MQQKKLVSAVALMGSMAALTACNNGDDVNVDLGSGSGGNGGGGGTVSTCPDWTSPEAQTSDGTNVCAIENDIEENRTLTSDIRWILDGKIEVGNGNSAAFDTESEADNLTLTIEPGTDIRGGRADSWLIITRGSQIDAAGTADNPITFSSEDDDLEGAGEWGGLVLQGFAQANPGNNVDAEAGLGIYGPTANDGVSNDDSSGTVQYVRITEGGFEVAPGEELNGFTLFGVGNGTTIDHIQVNDNQDDGIEFFGGTAQVSHLVLTDNLDDSIDFDLGWQGNIQYAIVKKNSESDRGIESDNNGSDFDATPRTRPTIANLTIVGASGAGANALHREGMGGFIHNAIYDTGDACLDVDDQDTEINNDELIYDDVILNCAANTAGEDDDGSGNEFATQIVNNNRSNTVYDEDPMLDENTYQPSSANSTFGSAKNFNTVQTNAAGSTCGSGGSEACATADMNFLDETDYLGAVDPDASSPFWFEGWTLEGTL